MSFEVAVASTGGNDTILAKSCVIAVERGALAWYSMLGPKAVYSWEDILVLVEDWEHKPKYSCNQNIHLMVLDSG